MDQVKVIIGTDVYGLDKIGTVTKELSNLKDNTASASKEFSNLKDVTSVLAVAAEGAAAVFAAWKLKDLIQDATLLAARVETLGVVMAAVGKNSGYTSREMDEVSKAIAAQGITTEGSRQAAVRLTQAHVDLTKSTQLARIAQDAAVIANTNSSDAFDRMTTGIATGQAIILHHMGLMVNFEQGYVDLARTLGKSKDELTEQEKTQVRVNEVMKAGEGITGSYEAAMGTAGKQLTSLTRYFEEIKLAVGEPFNQTFSLVLQDVNHGLKEVLATMKDSKSEFAEWGSAIATTYRFLRDEIRLLSGDIAGLQSLYTGATQLGLKGAELGTRFLTIGQYGGGFGAMADAAGATRQRQLNAYHRGREADDAYEASLVYSGPTMDPKEAMLLQMAKDGSVKKPITPSKETEGKDSDTTDKLWNSYLTGLYGFNKEVDALNPNLTDLQKKLSGIDDSLARQLERFAGYEGNPGVQAYTESLKRAAQNVKDLITLNAQLKGDGRGLTPREQHQFDQASMLQNWAAKDADYQKQEKQATFDHLNTLDEMRFTSGQKHIDSVDAANRTIIGSNNQNFAQMRAQLIDQYNFEQAQAEAKFNWEMEHSALMPEQEARAREMFRQKQLAAETQLTDALMTLDLNRQKSAFDNANVIADLDHQITQNKYADLNDQRAMIIEQFNFEQQQAELKLQWTLDHTILTENQKERIKEEYRKKEQIAEQKLQASLKANESTTWQTRLGYAAEGTNAMVSLTNSLVTLTGNKSKEMFIIQKMAASANAVVNTALGVTKALAEVPYPYDFVVAGMIAAAGAAQIATIAAADMGSGTGANSTSLSGTGGGTVGSPVVTQPTPTAQTQQQGNITIQILGNVIGEDKWVEDNLIPAINSAGSRDVKITYM